MLILAGIISILSNSFFLLFCVSIENSLIDSISLSNREILYALFPPKGKISIISPRKETSPFCVTILQIITPIVKFIF